MLQFGEHIERRLAELPALPGVYIMKNAQGKIIYIGKAKVLKNRVRSYFDGSDHTGHRAATLMLPYIRDIEWIITESESEALILEANLIRKHTPKYNVLLKDDKHFPYLAFSVKEPFPRLFLTRSVHKDDNLYYGPFMGSRMIDQLIDLSARLFHIRECKLKLPLAKPQRPCLNYHIGRCDAPCAGLISEEAYREKVEQAKLLLEGKRDDLLERWQREMEEASANLDFETAGKRRDAIQALQATGIHQKTDVSDPNLSLDILTLRRNGTMAAAVIFEYRNGVLRGRRHYRLECKLEDDATEIFRQMVLPWYMDVPMIPAEIATDIDLPEDAELLQQTLSEKAGRKVQFTNPQRGEKVGFLKLAGANADMILVEMRSEVQKYSEIDQSVFELQKVLGLKKTPFRIECVDISHLSGTNTVASLVAFKNGKPDKHLDDGERKTLLARFWRGSDITIRRRTLCTLVVPAVKGQKDGKGDEEDPRVEPSATAIAENEHRKERYGDKPRARDKCCRRPRDKRADERRDAENHRNIENTAAIGVAEREISMTRKPRQGAHAKLRRARPETDDYHANYERRNAERLGYLSRAVDKHTA